MFMYIQFVVFPTWSNDFRYMYIFPCACIIFLHPLLSGLWSSYFICFCIYYCTCILVSNRFPSHMMVVSFNSNTTGVTSGAGIPVCFATVFLHPPVSALATSSVTRFMDSLALVQSVHLCSLPADSNCHT